MKVGRNVCFTVDLMTASRIHEIARRRVGPVLGWVMTRVTCTVPSETLLGEMSDLFDNGVINAYRS